MFRFVVATLVTALFSQADGRSTAQVSSTPGCSVIGLDILKSIKKIQKVDISYKYNSTIVYYGVQFCKDKKYCLIAQLDEMIVGPESGDTMQDIKLWGVLLSTIMGYYHINPYETSGLRKQKHHFFSMCEKDYQFVIKKPTTEMQSKIEEVRKKIRPDCLNGGKCTKNIQQYEDSPQSFETKLSCAFECSLIAENKR